MVEKFNSILLEIQRDKGIVNVFAIIKMDEITEKWSVVFCAPWVEQQNGAEVFNYLRELLLRHLSSEEVSTISRLSIFSKNDPLIQLILRAVRVENSNVNLIDTTLNGFKIHEAHIFESFLPQ